MKTRMFSVRFDQFGIAFSTVGEEITDKLVLERRTRTNKKTKEMKIFSAYKRRYRLPEDINVIGLREVRLAEIETAILRKKDIEYPKVLVGIEEMAPHTEEDFKKMLKPKRAKKAKVLSTDGK